MHLTDPQRSTLKAAILADQTAEPMFTNGNLGGLADYFNAPASPAFTLWRTGVSRDDVTVDGFDWTQVDNLTVGQARIWDLLFDNSTRTINAAEAGKRAGVSECWKGTAAKVAVATFVLSKCKRPATRFEKLFAVGVGSDASPAGYSIDKDGAYIQGPISYTEFQGL